MSRSHLGEVQLRKAEAAADEGDLERARGLYLKALGFYAPDALEAALARVDLATIHAELDALDDAQETLERALPVLEAEARAGAPKHLVRALNQLGVLRRQAGQLEAARQLHEQARQTAAEAGDIRQQAVAMRNLAQVEQSQGNLTQAVSYLTESAELQEADGEQRGVARVWRQVRLIELEAGRLPRAYAAAKRELALRERVGEDAGIAATLLDAARLGLLLGRHEQAEGWLSRAAELRHRLGDRQGAAVALIAAAELQLERRCPRAARRLLDQAAPLVEGDAPAALRAELACVQAACDLAVLDAYAHEDDPLLRVQDEALQPGDEPFEEQALVARARREAEQGLSLCRQTSELALHARAYQVVARACAHQRETVTAREHFRASLEAADELPAGAAQLPRVHTVLLRYAAWLGRHEDAAPDAATRRRAARDYLERAALMAERGLEQGLSPHLAVQARAALAVLQLRHRERPAAGRELERAQQLLGEPLGEAARGVGGLLREDLELLARRVSGRGSGELSESDVMLRQADAAARDHAERMGSDELRDAFYQLRRIQEITKALNSELEIDRLLDLIIDAAIELSGAERGFLILIGDAPDAVAFKVARNIERRELERPDRKVSNTIAQAALESGQPVVTADATADERFSGAMSVVAQRLRSVASVPLLVQGQVTGTIYLDHRFKDGLFQARTVEILSALADQAALALENARLRQVDRERAAALEQEKQRLATTVESQIIELRDVKERLAEQARAEGERYRYDQIIGRSPAMQAVFRLLDKVTTCDIPVFIHGESGTGKELIARAIHYNSARATGPIVSENFAAIVEELIESELFGHTKGSFTGAVSDKKGLFERANGGTIFLDEVGDLSPKMQTELLRVLEEREVRRIGSSEQIPVNVRLISATHRDLKTMVGEGTFRQDLFYRLHVFTIELPPLRERQEDIPLLAEHFLGEYVKAHPEGPQGFTAEALRKLVSFRWPGNVRQLRNFITRTALLCPGEVIEAEHVSFGSKNETRDAIEDLSLATWSEAKDAFARRYLKAVLERVEGNVSAAARETGMLRQAFQRLLKRHEVSANDYRA